MRRVLLISSFFPPSVKVGAVRAGGLAKHLPRFGWEAVALTPELPGRKPNHHQIIETGHRDILADFKARLGFVQKVRPARQLDFAGQQTASTTKQQMPNPVAKWLRAAIIYPDEYKGWVPFGVKALEEFAKRERIDAILSTSPANSGHIIASHAKSMWGCPWIADLRDLWSDAGTAPWGMGFLQRRLEKHTLRSADILVTVSDPWVQWLQQTFPKKSVIKIVNGFDPDDLGHGAGELTSNFSITYTGYLYLGKSDPTPVFVSL
ncbi:MAG: glycosyltransferase, partial [Acidobacteriaceae bacterium]|nr:glycosyltransferase [Acidobacteriaceae bacterium]